MSTDDCKFCNRQGLSFLPVRIAYVAETKSPLPDALSTFEHLPIAAISDGQYALRVITEGYVYLYDERATGTWRCFGATPSGHFREYLLDASPLTPPAFQCAQKGHGDVASLVSIQRARDAGEVWVGYSRVWLTKATRKLLKNDTKLRNQLMVRLNAADVVKGGAIPPGSGLRVSSGAELATLVGEYAMSESVFTVLDRRYASNTTTPATDRHGHADALVARMHANSPNNAIVLALPDAVGIVQDLNHWRNLKAGELAKYQGDAAKLESRIVGDLILGIEDAMKKQGQAKTWGERYAPKVDMKKVRADKTAHQKKIAEFEARILKASDDWAAWTRSQFFKNVWRLYDGADAQEGRNCGEALERDFTYCVFGSGGTPKEQAWWKEWLTAEVDDENHPLWLAFAAGDKDLLAFLKSKASKGVSLWKSGRKLNTEITTWKKKRAASAALRLAQQQSGMLATTMASQVQQLAKSAPEDVLLISQRMRVVIASRLDIEITPTFQKITIQQFVVQLHETVWGPPKTGLSQTVTEARSMRIAQSMDGAWLGTQFSSTKIIEIETWLPEPATKLGAQAPLKALPTAATMLALPRPALNPWQGMSSYLKGLKGSGGTILGLGAALNMLNIATSLDQLDQALASTDAKRDEAISKSLYGVASGALGVMAITAEIIAGVLKARVVPAVATTTAAKLLSASAWTALGGGALGVVTGGMEAIQALKKRHGLLQEGDTDAATSYGSLAICAGTGAIASGALAIIGAGTLLAQAGATGAAATAVIATGSVLSAIPVAGWIILAIGAVAAGVYFAWTAVNREDTPLEKWLSRCCYRDDVQYKNTSRAKFTSLGEGMTAFQQAIYGLTVTLDWNDRIGKDEIDLAIIMPGYSAKTSDYAFLLQVSGPQWKRTVIDRKTSVFSEDPDLKPQPPSQLYFSAAPAGQKTIPIDEVLEIAQRVTLESSGGASILRAKVRVNEDYFNSVRLRFEYWPDVINNPTLKFTPAMGGANYVDKKD